MDHIPQDDILQIGLNLYKLTGEHMKYSSKRLTVFRIFNCVIFAINVIVTVASFKNAQGETYMKSMEGSTTTIHIFAKYICFLHYKGDIENLLDEVKYFWSYKEGDRKLYRDIKNIHYNVEKLQKFIMVSVACIMVMFALRPIVTQNRFIFYTWTPWNSMVCDAIVLFAQYYMLILILPTVFAYDSIYLSVSVHVISQIKVLNYKLEHMETSGDNARIYECIRHHQLLKTIFEHMKGIYFWLLLFHYMVTLLTGCSQMFIILVGNTKLMDLLLTAMYIWSLFFEFAFYAFPVEVIVSELQHISTSIYMSAWYERNIIQKKLLLFMMMTSQRQTYLSIGGMMDMNVDAFGSVIRKVFSFCAILRNILED